MAFPGFDGSTLTKSGHSLHVAFQSESVFLQVRKDPGPVGSCVPRPSNRGSVCCGPHVCQSIHDVRQIFQPRLCTACPQVTRAELLMLTMIGNVGSACEQDATLEEFTLGCNATVAASQVLPLPSIRHVVTNGSTSVSSPPSLHTSSHG